MFVAPGPRCLETVINRDLRFAAQPGAGGQAISPQLRALAAEDPDFLADLIEGETNLLELIGILDASIRPRQWFPVTGVAPWHEFAPCRLQTHDAGNDRAPRNPISFAGGTHRDACVPLHADPTRGLRC